MGLTWNNAIGSVIPDLTPASVASHRIGQCKILATVHQVELEHLVERVRGRKGESLVATVGFAAKHLVKERLRSGMARNLKSFKMSLIDLL